MDAFRAYFLSHAAFVVRVAAPSPHPQAAEAPPAAAGATGGETPTTVGAEAARNEEEHERLEVWGAFYIKPNFPGRCSHVCNGGFITDPRRRRRGVARLMGHAFLRFARDLGYRASYFNLVRVRSEKAVATIEKRYIVPMLAGQAARAFPCCGSSSVNRL